MSCSGTRRRIKASVWELESKKVIRAVLHLCRARTVSDRHLNCEEAVWQERGPSWLTALSARWRASVHSRAGGGPTEENVGQNYCQICSLQVSGLKLNGVSQSGTQITRPPAAPSVCNPINPLLPSL